MTVIFKILAGVGVFLFGCRFLSENMEKLSTGKIKKLFLKASDKKAVGVGVGAAVTALVQSSGLTLVMVIGLVNAGIMTLAQAATVIIGANIGTTITAHIAALQAFKFIDYAIGLAGVGVFVAVFAKKEKTKYIGNIVGGLGIIFVGLMLMSEYMKEYADSEKAVNILKEISNPFLLFLVGIIFTAFLQSSSAVTSIIISMASADIIIGGGGNSVLFVILGCNIGSCVTGLLSSVGASSPAKRAGVIHLLFNVLGSLIFFIVLYCWKNFMACTFGRWFPSPGFQIAMFHTFFNVVCAAVFLPFTNGLVKMSYLIIPDRMSDRVHTFLDKRFLTSPGIAIESTMREMMMMLDLAIANLSDSIDGFIGKDESYIGKVNKQNRKINEMSKDITEYIVHISPRNLTIKDEKYISALHDSIGDIVRISELADNIAKYTDREIKEDLVFSAVVKEGIGYVTDLIFKQANNIKSIVLYQDFSVLSSVEELEDEIDNARRDLVKGHIARLNSGECRAESSSVFINLANNLERVGDHLYYIAQAINNIK